MTPDNYKKKKNMQEFTINLREDGSAVIARDKWNKDHSIKAMDEAFLVRGRAEGG